MDQIFAECRLTDKNELLGRGIYNAFISYNSTVSKLVSKHTLNGLNEQAQLALRKLQSAVDVTGGEEPFRIEPSCASIDAILGKLQLKKGELKLVEQKKKELLQAYAQRLQEGQIPCGMLPSEAIDMAERFRTCQ